MNSSCMSSTCITNDVRVPVRATYVNLYKWPDSDREFVRSVSRNSNKSESNGSESRHHGHPRVVDSISCRQLYLKSYTFSRKESLNEKTMNCIGRVKEKASSHVHGKQRMNSEGCERRRRDDGGKRRRSRKKCTTTVVMTAKETSYAAFVSIFRRLLSCTTKIDVVD